jgi:hypothetical protein
MPGRELADWLGSIHIHASAISRQTTAEEREYPSMTIAGPGGVAWHQLAAEGDPPTREQPEWGQMIAASGQSWKVWRPDQLVDRTIEAELRALAAQPKANTVSNAM